MYIISVNALLPLAASAAYNIIHTRVVGLGCSLDTFAEALD